MYCKIKFVTNIDAYRRFLYLYPDKLPFRPHLGDRVLFARQDEDFPQLPVLCITSLSYRYDIPTDEFVFTCYLHFGNHTHPDIARKILNHEVY